MKASREILFYSIFIYLRLWSEQQTDCENNSSIDAFKKKNLPNR